MKKYEKVTREDYKEWYADNKEYREKVRSDGERLCYHLMPETGWLNDPNGLCQFQGDYHIYYQYTPFEPTGEIKLWGHFVTKDFISYEKREPVLFPDKDFDAHGVYSGSAFVEDDVIHFFYTGNVKKFDSTDYDYIQNGRESNTIHCYSKDGNLLENKELLLTNEDYPNDMSAHIRDPKIIKWKDAYYMVLGARDKNSKGMALLYKSKDLKNWKYAHRITTKDTFGYMWECPDLFLLDGQLCLLMCPQGVKARGIDFQNVHQCTMTILDSECFCQDIFIESSKSIYMVDRGFDFYAPQTFEDEKGRRILIGWMGIPDAEYTNPTVKAGWQHALTIPRVLSLREGRLIQQPIEELQRLRRNERTYMIPNPILNEDKLVYEAKVNFEFCKNTKIQLRKGVELLYENQILSLLMGACGSGRTVRSVAIKELRELTVFSDTTSLEVFINHGTEVFTTRVYGHDGGIELTGNCKGSLQVFDMLDFIMAL